MIIFTNQAAAIDTRIIDMHGHGSWPDGDAQQELVKQLQEMDAAGVQLRVVALTSQENIAIWNSAPSGRLIIAAMLPCPKNLGVPWYYCFPDTQGLPDPDWLREQVATGKVQALHELMFNYDGSLATDNKMQAYWSLAAEFDIPVGVHTNSGPPPGRSIRSDPNCCPDYSPESGNPRHLRPILEQHPNLRIWLQHVGSDAEFESDTWIETLSLMRDYQSVYVDLSITNSKLPLEIYEQTLLELIAAGFGDRIMFGSDGVPVKEIVDRLESLQSIDKAQKKAILYDNAARFLGLEQKSVGDVN